MKKNPIELEIAKVKEETRDEDGSPTSEFDEGFIQGLERALELT